jgi:hypothetical protein
MNFFQSNKIQFEGSIYKREIIFLNKIFNSLILKFAFKHDINILEKIGKFSIPDEQLFSCAPETIGRLFGAHGHMKTFLQAASYDHGPCDD